MRMKRRKHMNNKGFSLVELLVALAVSAVVITIIGAFVSQGTGFYSEQGNAVNLQNELQEVSNVITDTIQEATYLEFDSSCEKIYTGEYKTTEGGSIFETGKETARLISWDGKNIHIVNKPSLSQFNESDLDGYRYSKYVSEFSVTINENCILPNGDIKQPLVLDIAIKVSNNGADRHEKKSITLRNVIHKLTLDGVSYIRQGDEPECSIENRNSNLLVDPSKESKLKE